MVFVKPLNLNLGTWTNSCLKNWPPNLSLRQGNPYWVTPVYQSDPVHCWTQNLPLIAKECEMMYVFKKGSLPLWKGPKENVLTETLWWRMILTEVCWVVAPAESSARAKVTCYTTVVTLVPARVLSGMCAMSVEAICSHLVWLHHCELQLSHVSLWTSVCRPLLSPLDSESCSFGGNLDIWVHDLVIFRQQWRLHTGGLLCCLMALKDALVVIWSPKMKLGFFVVVGNLLSKFTGPQQTWLHVNRTCVHFLFLSFTNIWKKLWKFYF